MNKNRQKRIVASTQVPVEGEAGKTGSWRTLRPVLNLEACTCAKKQEHVCHLCWLYCPDAAISMDEEGYPSFNYEYCKGCGVCANECRVGAIKLVREA